MVPAVVSTIVVDDDDMDMGAGGVGVGNVRYNTFS
jgi:hypothetical protein